VLWVGLQLQRLHKTLVEWATARLLLSSLGLSGVLAPIMAEKSPVVEFQFVNSTVASPTVPQDLAVRALIRKQAMKKASAARRRDGNYGKHNLRQYPVFLFDQNNNIDGAVLAKSPVKELCHLAQTSRAVEKDGHVKDEDENVRSKQKSVRNTAERQRWLAKYTLAENLPASLSPRDYEMASMKSDFDILGLSTMATLHVNRAARAALSKNPYHLIYQLRSSQQWSYLSFLPSRYGQVSCLKDATDCVISRARQIISPSRNWEYAVISSYVKALDSLQKALDDPKQRFKPEVLCATEILALYEVLISL
jgi:hypothetical protein